MKIEKNGVVVEDSNDNLIELEEGVTCGCENPHLKMTFYMDGREYYQYGYQCSCGNSITATHKRNPIDMMMWE